MWSKPLLMALVSVVFAREGGSQDVLQSYQATAPGANFGISVDSAGDADGDGHPDQIVGSDRDWENGLLAGSASLFHGFDGTLRFKWLGNPKESLGRAVSYVGDNNLDGYCDVAISVPGAKAAGFGLGTLRVASGSNGATLLEIHAPDGMSPTLFPASIGEAGDINGDGIEDIAASTPSAGVAWVFSGADGAVLISVSGPPGICPAGILGPALGIGDVDGDQVPDVVVGTCDTGGARVISGADGSDIYYVPGGTATGLNGTLASVGDVDGDQIVDFLTSSTRDDTFGENTGITRLFSGATGSLIHAVYGTEPNGSFGGSLGGLGDMNGDGVLDFMIGASTSDEGIAPGSGRVFVHSGTDASLLLTLEGAPGTLFGTSLSNAGDVDGDSLTDFIVSAVTEGGQSSGAAHVYSGRCGTLTRYGSGCPGEGGFTPLLSTSSGCANAGQAMTINLSGALGGSTALVLFGAGQGDVPIGGGCSVLLHPIFPVVLPISLSGFGPGSGSFTLFTSIPSAVAGQTFAIQALVPDPFASVGYAASNGLLIQPK